MNNSKNEFNNIVQKSLLEEKDNEIKLLKNIIIEKDKEIEELYQEIETLNGFITSSKKGIINIEVLLNDFFKSMTMHNKIEKHISNINNKLNNFESEDISYIYEDKSFLNTIIKNLPISISVLIGNIYRNDNHPENITIKTKNYKEKQMLIYKNDNWIIMNTDDAISIIIEKIKNILLKHYYENKEIELDNKSIETFLLSLSFDNKNLKNYKRVFNSIKSVLR